MKLRYPSRQQWAVYTLLFLLLLILGARAGFEDDVDCWMRWGTYTQAHGLGMAYQVPDNNYPPLFHYFLFLYGKLTGSAANFVFYRRFLKVLVLPFDFAGALLAAWYFTPGGRNQRFTASLLLLANIAFVYNTVVWEQVDGLFSCLVFGAVVLALRQRGAASLVCYLLAINAKAQAILFLPPLLLLWAPLWWRAPRQLLWGVGSAAAVQLLVLAPFIWGGDPNGLDRIVGVFTRSVDYYPVVSMNANNWWKAAFAYNTPDTIRFAGLTYKHWGLLGFLLASTAVLLPLALAAWRKLRQGQVFGTGDHGPLLLSLALLPVVFGYFNTQMHERYWHPALLFLAAYSFLARRYFVYGLFSLAYVLNLEYVMHYLGLKKYGVAVFSAPLGAGLFTVVLVLGFIQLYRMVGRTPGWRGQSVLATAPSRPAG